MEIVSEDVMAAVRGEIPPRFRRITNVRLPAALYRRAKIASVRLDLSLSAFTARAIEELTARVENEHESPKG
jgi:hypothetical protein